MTSPAPGRALRLALVAWGLGDLAMGRFAAGVAWLLGEAILLAAVVATTLLFADTTWYLLPFLLGTLFLGAWAGQAVLAYRRAQRREGAIPPAPARSPALAVAWLALPLLLWGTGFWLFAAGAATPEAVMDRFVTAWPDAASADGRSSDDPFAGVSADPVALHAAATEALDRLDQRCRAGLLQEDCARTPSNLLRDVRVRVEAMGDGAAVAVAELVDYERRPTTFLGFITASELVPVARERILTVELRTTQSTLGARRWTIVNADAS